jgi:hypothetical protein
MKPPLVSLSLPFRDSSSQDRDWNVARHLFRQKSQSILVLILVILIIVGVSR